MKSGTTSMHRGEGREKTSNIDEFLFPAIHGSSIFGVYLVPTPGQPSFEPSSLPHPVQGLETGVTSHSDEGMRRGGEMR